MSRHRAQDRLCGRNYFIPSASTNDEGRPVLKTIQAITGNIGMAARTIGGVGRILAHPHHSSPASTALRHQVSASVSSPRCASRTPRLCMDFLCPMAAAL